MKRSVDIDDELASEVDRAAALIREKPATIIRLALRAGLPSIISRFQAPRPEGYFSDAYRNYPAERLKLEAAMARKRQSPKR